MSSYKTDHQIHKALRKLELNFEKKLSRALTNLFNNEFYIKAHDGFIFFHEGIGFQGVLYTLRFTWSKDMNIIIDLNFDPTCSYYNTLPLFIENKKEAILEFVNLERTAYRALRAPLLNI